MTTRALTEPEILALESALLARHRLRDRLFLLTALGTGFRAQELLSISWRQLLTATGEVAREVTIERAHLKGGAGVRKKAIRSRRIPLTERVRGAIADYLGTHQAMPSGPVFKSRLGGGAKAITRGQAHRWLKRLARELGLDATRLGCHSCRKHFAAQIHAAGGFDLTKTQRIMGHRSCQTTAVYLDHNSDLLDGLVLGLDQTSANRSLGTLPSPSAGLTLSPQTAA